ncbi:MAG: SDR family NAD(P)-dependent oxidoreductase [Halieaceae bacterium]|nr:SDR family NAD(P)-dependent oxidoreductase [Halieaceae bacterium]
MRFENSRVLVTGAASGIGRATALAFTAEGARVLGADIDTAGLRETAALAGADSVFHRAGYDASSREACFGLADAAREFMGGVDVLCNIAGFAQSRHFTEYTQAEWEKMLAVNLSGVFYCAQAVMPMLLETSGCMVNMASSAGLVGQAYQASYCATKGGVVMLSKALAMEYAGRGVRVNAICPGSVATPLVENFSMPQGAEPQLLQRLYPLLETAQPEEIAAAVLYLAGPEARYITGITLPIDGAQTAG